MNNTPASITLPNKTQLNNDEVKVGSVVTVVENLNPRYRETNFAPLSEQTMRPISWDDRFFGIEQVKLVDGAKISIYCSGQQSSPEKGWMLYLNGELEGAFTWTLYGISK